MSQVDYSSSGSVYGRWVYDPGQDRPCWVEVFARNEGIFPHADLDMQHFRGRTLDELVDFIRRELAPWRIRRSDFARSDGIFECRLVVTLLPPNPMELVRFALSR